MQHITKSVEYPKKLKSLYATATRYEWISFFYMISAAILSFTVMSNSQTMKTIWLEDTLGIIPPLSFLIANKILKKRANKNFPYGFHKATGMAFLISAFALLVLGIYLLLDGFIVLIKREHPDITNFFIFNHSIWFGYIMILALLWSSVPSTILGHIKIGLAKQLYDKILYSDSKMNKASWMSGFASILGIIGIGFGLWWADALVGMLISISIIHDGYSNLKQATFDLLDEIPKTITGNKTDPLIDEVKKLALQENWISDVQLRFRDEGHIFFGDIFVKVKDAVISVEKINNLRNKIQGYHWRLHDIVIMPYKE